MLNNPVAQASSQHSQRPVSSFCRWGGSICRFFRPAVLTWQILLLLGASAIPASAQEPGLGEFGGAISFLRKNFSAPKKANETNYYLDLWEGSRTERVARLMGLLDNRALFINAHGKRIPENGRYAIYPHACFLSPGQTSPLFSPADIATLMGPEAAGAIHNILISSCNYEGALSAAEFRKHFPNATNIVHTPPGQGGYQEMFFQVFANHSSKISPLYESRHKLSDGSWGYQVSSKRSPISKKLHPYVAELFRPDATLPYSRQLAGNELLLNTAPPALALLRK